MMKRIVATLFFLLLGLGVLALIAPSFINWSKHKEAILSQLEPYIQRKIEVGGNVSFRILPSPQIMLENVTLANIEGAKAPALMTLKQLEARMKLGPLLQGRFEIENINLANPKVDLEVLADGHNNWSDILKPREQGGGIGTKAEAVQLNKVSMTGGTLHYFNAATGTEWQADSLDLDIAADTLYGPYKVKGDMRYNNTNVAIEMGTGKYEAGTPVPVNIVFTPAEAMPKVALSGVADLSADLGLQTEVTVSQGSIASLFNSDFVNGISFLTDPADATAMLNVKGGEVALTDIKAKTGKKGEFSGTLTALFAQGKKPDITADLSGSNLKVAAKPGFLEIPAGFTPHLKLKGKNITWGGIWLPGVTLSADAIDKEWDIKSAQIDLPGKSKVKLAGVVTPKNKYGAFSIQASSDDAQKMLKPVGLSDGNILKSLAASGLLKKLDLSASLDVKEDKVSLFDIDAKVNEGAKVSGVLNIARGTKQPKFDAHLNFDQGDIAAPLSDAYADFMGSLMKSDAALDVSVKNFTKGDMAGADFAFKGKVNGGVMNIESMTGTLQSTGNFTVSGKLASINPLSGMDLDYTLKSPQLGGLAAYGVEIPPPLSGANAVDVKGKVTGDAAKYGFTVNGAVQNATVSLEGNATAGNQGSHSYQTDVKLKNASWAQIGLPLDTLLADAKPVSLSAKLSGARDNYKLDNIDAGGVTGSLGFANGKYSGDLVADAADFDKWLWEKWKVSDALDLKLKAKKLVWRSDDFSNAQLQLEAGPKTIKVSSFNGELWGGNVTADIDAAKDGDNWKGKLKGKIDGADLQAFATLMEFKGVTLGRGDLTMDVAEDSAKAEKNWFHGMDGDIGLQADSLTVENFSPAAMSRVIANLKDGPLDDFPAQAMKALRSADTTYKGIDGSFKIGEGRIDIVKLRLADADASVDTDGGFDLGPETFKVNANIRLKSPAGIPPFTVNRSGKMKSAPAYSANFRPVQTWLAQSGQKAPPAVAVVPRAPEQMEAPLRSPLPPEDANVMPTHVQPDNVPVQIYPPPEKPLPDNDDDITDPNDSPVHPPVEPPPAVVPGDDNGDTGEIINHEPIDTEQLDAPQGPEPVPAPPEEMPPQPGQKPPKNNSTGNDSKPDDFRGVIDRLNASPGEVEPPAEDFTEQKPDAPAPTPKQSLPDEGAEILPKE